MGKLIHWANVLPSQTLARAGASRVPRWVTLAGRAFTDLLFPPVCLACGHETRADEQGFCQQCYRELTSVPGPICPRCAKPVPPSTPAGGDGCVLCFHKRLRFRRAMALGIYGGAMRDLVIRMKQARNEALSLQVGQRLGERVKILTSEGLPDLVAPVPMHWTRRLQRGINTSELLAEAIARQLQRPTRLHLLCCRRRTKKQGTLLPNERRRNVLGAYRLRRRARVAGAHVLLVDDVMTTGATANELAKVLLRGGAREVSIAVVARGVGFD